MSADALLSQLHKVRGRGPSQWSAQCPAHDDKGPSLSIKELSDGRVLLHCFAGCSVDEVVGAVGLDLSDLFPPREVRGEQVQRKRLISAGQALDLLHAEAQLIAMTGANIGHGVSITDDDRVRVLQAAGRVAYLLDEVRS